MGLDASAYRRLSFKVPAPADRKDIDWDAVEGLVDVWEHPDFPGRLGGLKPGFYESADGMDAFGGAYSAYNRWREWLAQIAGYPATPVEIYGRSVLRHDAGTWATESGPFWELINFSDCEGVIGTSICQKLAKDFATMHDHAKAASGLSDDGVRGDGFFTVYERWQKAFEFASDAGCVDFH